MDIVPSKRTYKYLERNPKIKTQEGSRALGGRATAGTELEYIPEAVHAQPEAPHSQRDGQGARGQHCPMAAPEGYGAIPLGDETRTITAIRKQINVF